MKRIKVIEYITNLGDGGAETLVKDYVKLIDRNRFDISVIVTRDFGPSANSKIIKESGIPIIYIYPHWNIFIRLWNKIMGFWYVPYRLRKIIRSEKADVLHVHLALLKYVNRIRSSLGNVRLFFTCHSVVNTVFGKGFRSETKAAKKLIKHNNLRLIALHDDMAKELNQIFGIDNTVVIRNGIDFKRFIDPGVNKSDERKELNIPQDAFVIGHVGRFNPVKNHDFLVEVFREIYQKKDNAFLLMVGAGDASSIVERLNEYGLQNRFLILSHRNDINRILEAMDVFVFPSIYEGLGIALIEAQVSGLKCVASDNVPIEAFKTENAISLPLGDPQRWAEVILDENAKGTSHGHLNDYDMNKEIKRLEKLYMGELDV